MRTSILVLLALFMAIPTFAQKARYAPPSNPKKTAAMQPNLDISTYRRCYTSDEKIEMDTQTFNLHGVDLAAYPLDLNAAVPNSAAMDDFGKTIRSLDLTRRHPAARWKVSSGKIYIDQWKEFGANVPKLPPGTYIIDASADGVDKRTWIAVTNAALLVKRSREELLIYAADVVSGKPLPGVDLLVEDTNGLLSRGRTGADGTMRIPATSGIDGNLWIDGDSALGPVFAVSGPVAAPDPFTIYTITDRPIYRPGTLVQYKATIRRRIEAPGPSGFRYAVYAKAPVTVEIRDATDALIRQQTVTTTAAGSLDGNFQLAPECSQGDWHINIVIGKFTSYADFNVASYRKPEMTATLVFDKPHYLGGETARAVFNAMYYFGRPVTQGDVKYQVNYAGSDGSYNGEGITDSHGNLVLSIPTKRMPDDQNMWVTATVTDLSRRSISATGSTLIAAGLFQLSLQAEKGIYKPGKRITLTVQATDYDNKPVATTAQVTMNETEEDRAHRTYVEKTTHKVVIGANGLGTVAFSSPRVGILSFEATAFDSEQDKIQTSTTVVISDLNQPIAMPDLALVPNQENYHPGQTAVVAIDTTFVGRPFIPATETTPARPAHPDAWALVTVEGLHLGMDQLVHLTAKHSTIRIPLTDRDSPGVTLDVAVIQDHLLTEQEIELPVIDPSHTLSVTLTPDKNSYQPGDPATYTVTTRDSHKQPVSAEVSLGVVDASIYDIQPDNSPEMSSYFYPDQSINISSDFSFAAQYSGGGYQVVASSGAAAVGGIRVRRNFADTAYWQPSVTTGADGTATVRFTMPDNLTRWRATAHAITMQTSVGSATNDVISVMPLLVRLELPRFVVTNDECVVSAIVQNGTKDAHSVAISITSKGATLEGDTHPTINLASGGQKRLDWKAVISGPDAAVFDVTANGGVGASDATESTLPVLPDGLKMVTANADVLSKPSASETIDLSKLPPSASITLNLSSSLAVSVRDAVDTLVSLPYGDAEDSASALIADVAAYDAARQSPTGRLAALDTGTDVSLALQKLYLYQHPDGGWNWWEFDQTDGDMTAVVLDALLRARQSGFTVDPQRILRGSTALQTQLDAQQDPETSANWLAVLAQADPTNARKPLAALYKDRAHLDDYGIASLAIGLHADGLPADSALAMKLIGQLAGTAIQEGSSVSWAGRPQVCYWSDDDVLVTAHCLYATLLVDPGSALAPGAVRWLMANRDGAAWDSTRADAEAVRALTLYEVHSGELKADYTATIQLDGTTLSTFTASGSETTPLAITLTPDELAGHKSLIIAKQGDGVLYLSRQESFIIPAAQVIPGGSGIHVQKRYQIVVDDPTQSESLLSGAEMQVQLDIDADNDYRYVRLEDPIPAGCEVDDDQGTGTYPIDFSDGSIIFTQRDVRDNRVVFSFDNLPKGHTRLVYTLTTEQPGLYTILPSTISLNYFPSVRGNSGLAHVSVMDAP